MAQSTALAHACWTRVLSGGRAYTAVARGFSSVGTSDNSVVSVSALDPKLAFDRELQQQLGTAVVMTEAARVTFNLRTDLLPLVAQAQFELGTGDEPESHWVFGRRGELFEYKLVGVHAVRSGYAALMRSDKADQVAGDRGMDQWHAFLKASKSGEQAWWPNDFLFAGRLENCASASIYVLNSGDGFMISSNYEPFGEGAD